MSRARTRGVPNPPEGIEALAESICGVILTARQEGVSDAALLDLMQTAIDGLRLGEEVARADIKTAWERLITEDVIP